MPDLVLPAQQDRPIVRRRCRGVLQRRGELAGVQRVTRASASNAVNSVAG